MWSMVAKLGGLGKKLVAATAKGATVGVLVSRGIPLPVAVKVGDAVEGIITEAKLGDGKITVHKVVWEQVKEAIDLGQDQ